MRPQSQFQGLGRGTTTQAAIYPSPPLPRPTPILTLHLETYSNWLIKRKINFIYLVILSSCTIYPSVLPLSSYPSPKSNLYLLPPFLTHRLIFSPLTFYSTELYISSIEKSVGQRLSTFFISWHTWTNYQNSVAHQKLLYFFCRSDQKIKYKVDVTGTVVLGVVMFLSDDLREKRSVPLTT